jgi:hypothetical protein
MHAEMGYVSTNHQSMFVCHHHRESQQKERTVSYGHDPKLRPFAKGVSSWQLRANDAVLKF